ncbi:dynein axonemal assembly factor 8 isoform X2 [Megalobrama amblycephala]|uniref:dynein axonemal assembly factor 8 isoform X2 n=1 Tax=Megalobrama amblycephala TaxID=75352 RepID=UPI002014112E|nr:dynein axonemal assembly factor 8 isoform X2 [Megalobrama amblycephala]
MYVFSSACGHRGNYSLVRWRLTSVRIQSQPQLLFTVFSKKLRTYQIQEMQRNTHLYDLISKIPSIDSDPSSSDNEEEISVLQRPQVIQLLKETRMNLECVSLEESEVKLFTSWTDDDQKGDKTDGSLNASVAHKTESNVPLQEKGNKTGWTETQLCPALTMDIREKQHEHYLMEQLVAFCEKKVNEMDIKTHVSSTKTPNIQESSLRYAGRQVKDFSETSAKLQLYQESPTIYIDLRNNTFQTKQSAISQSNSVISPVNMEKEMSSTKRTTKTNAKAKRQKREFARKILSLQNTRQSNQSVVEISWSCRNSQDFAEARQKDSSGKIIKEKQLHDFETSCSEPGIQQVNVCCSTAKYDQHNQNSSHIPAAQNKQSHKVRWQKDLKLLQTFRPQRSANNSEEAAERTDILYEPEASYLPSVNTLPADLQMRECLLLTVSLSSPGVVAGRMQRKAQTVDSVFMKSHLYNALIAWFLSLTDLKNSNRKGNKLDAPFWVAGLQQFYKEDGLALYICAMSLEDDCRKSRIGEVEKDESKFYRRVCKFFAQTSLKTVAFWVPQLNHLLEEQAYPTHVHMPSSYLDCFISVNPNIEAVEKAFSAIPGFYWQTLETEDQKCQRAEAINSQECHTETALVLIGRALFLNPLAMHHTLELMCRSSLDICGIRFLYPLQELLTNFAVCKSVMHSEGEPVLTVAFRGPHANSVWQEITGPSDPQLARRTDPASINALYHHSQDQILLYSPRLASLVHLGLCLWFGGRIAKNTLSMVQDSEEGDRGKRSQILTSSPATLCATVKADIFLIVSPVVGPCCYSYILSACAKTGFSLLGLQRAQISMKQAHSLGLTTKQVTAFCHAPTVLLDGEQVELSSHCLVLLMRRESAVRHCSRLPIGLMNELAAQGLIGSICARFTDVVGPHVCFHTVPYSKPHHKVLGGLMWTVPECSHMVLSKHMYPSWPDVEQVVVLTLTGQNIMKNEMGFLHKVLRGDEAAGFELLALKWEPKLSQRQAQELSPFEIGDREWQSSVQSLTSTPALVLALRRVRAFITLRRLLPQNYPGNLHILMSPTPETAFRQTCLFFSEAELVPDHSSRPSLKFLPLHHIDTPGLRSQSLYSYMTVGPEPLLTLALFKPGAWRHCFGKILTIIKQNGYTLVGLRVLLLDSNMANALMHPLEQQEPTEEMELKYLRSGPSLALGLLRVNAVMRLLELMGPEDPVEARTIDQTLWRAQYGSDRLRNGIYGSPSYRKAVEDIKLVFPEGVCCTETSVIRHEKISCLHSDPDASMDREQLKTLRTAVKNKFSSGFGQGPLACSALCQTTCLLIPSNLLQQSQPPLYSDLLQWLLRTGCHLVAGKLCTPNEKQRQHISELLRSSAGGALLLEGPCLIIALQADNAVTCFDIILERVCRERPDFKRVTMKLLYPNSKSGAVKLLHYLFDDHSLHRIAPH